MTFLIPFVMDDAYAMWNVWNVTVRVCLVTKPAARTNRSTNMCARFEMVRTRLPLFGRLYVTLSFALFKIGALRNVIPVECVFCIFPH